MENCSKFGSKFHHQKIAPNLGQIPIFGEIFVVQNMFFCNISMTPYCCGQWSTYEYSTMFWTCPWIIMAWWGIAFPLDFQFENQLLTQIWVIAPNLKFAIDPNLGQCPKYRPSLTDKTKLILISTKAEVVVEVGLEIDLKINFHGWLAGSSRNKAISAFN